MNLLKTSLRVLAMHREFRDVLTKLNGHSDHKLTELGLTRGDIARVAYAEAERRFVTPPASDSAPAPIWQDHLLVPGG